MPELWVQACRFATFGKVGPLTRLFAAFSRPRGPFPASQAAPEAGASKEAGEAGEGSHCFFFWAMATQTKPRMAAAAPRIIPF